MRKILLAITGLLVCTLSLTLVAIPVQGSIEDIYWITPLHRGYDEFYNEYVTAYRTGSVAHLLVSVYNGLYGYSSINITDVKVSFDWNLNYSSAECPLVLPRRQYHIFTINFSVPDPSVASNMLPHTYWVFVEFSYGGMNDYWSYYPSDYFAVYSSDQGDAVDASIRLNSKLSHIPYFYSHEAQMMLSEAQTESSTAEQYYMRGDFGTAKSHYETGLQLFNSAFDIESIYAQAQDKYGLAYSEAQANATKTEANAAMKQADAALNQSYAWFLFGIGFIIISIGALAYSIRQPKVARP